MTTEFNMSKKRVTYECRDCKAEVEVTVFAQYPDMRPLRCGTCAEKKTEVDRVRSLMALKEELIEASGIVEKFRHWCPVVAKEVGSAPFLPWITQRAGQSMWLGGDNGIGKSHAAHYVAYQRIIKCGDTVRAVRCSGLLNDIVGLRQGNKEETREARELLKRMQTVGILLLDDLCKEKLSPTKAEILWDIVDVREREGRRMWITTNRTGKDLAGRLGDDYAPAILKRLKRAIPRQNQIKSGDRPPEDPFAI